MQASAKIEKLSALLVRLSKGAQASVAKSENTEQHILYDSLPSSLDMVKLERIRREQKCELEYQTIMKYYERAQGDGYTRIKANISNHELLRLADTLAVINYKGAKHGF